MSDFAQYAAFGRALAAAPSAHPAPVRIPGLEALGRSSHGGAPVRGSVAMPDTPHALPRTSLSSEDESALA